MKHILEQIRANRSVWKIMILGYTIFNGCFMFPIVLDERIISFSYIYPLSMSLVMLGVMFVGLIDKRPLRVFFYTLIGLVIGMVLRYILEYGEVSNVRNFTPQNIGVFVIIVPIFITIVYSVTTQIVLEK